MKHYTLAMSLVVCVILMWLLMIAQQVDEIKRENNELKRIYSKKQSTVDFLYLELAKCEASK